LYAFFDLDLDYWFLANFLVGVTEMFKRKGTEGMEAEVLPALNAASLHAKEILLQKVLTIPLLLRPPFPFFFHSSQLFGTLSFNRPNEIK
jgi:hypothetical protein